MIIATDVLIAEIFDHPTIDHVIPLFSGGNNSMENIVPACTSCNSSKGKKSLLIWMFQQRSKTYE